MNMHFSKSPFLFTFVHMNMALNIVGNVTIGNIVVNPQQIIDVFQDNETRQAVIDLLGTSINLNLVSSHQCINCRWLYACVLRSISQ